MTHVLDDWLTYLNARMLSVFALNGIVDGKCSCWRGLDCDRPGKHPFHDGWQTETQTSETLAQLPAWINLGVRTGQGVVVIDIDDPTVARVSDYPPTFTVHTAKGHHLYYQDDSTKLFRTMVRWRDGVDIRAEGGLVVAPPSLHVSGVRYLPANDLPLAHLSPELHVQIPAQVERTARMPSITHPIADEDAPNYGPMAETLLDDMRDAQKGERNQTLFRLASRFADLIDSGMLRPIWLEELAEAAFTADLSWSEIQRTIASASGNLTDRLTSPARHGVRSAPTPKDGG